MTMTYEGGVVPARNDLAALYDSVGWSNYTRDPHLLHSAVENSLGVVTARAGGSLVGLARVVGDGLTIVYLQDILVHPEHQRHGIGRELFRRVFAPYGDVRQKVLITDDEPWQRAFYEAMGFTEGNDLDQVLRTFVHFA